jgi:hypothetical protein
MLDLLANDDEYWKHFQQSARHALPMTEHKKAPKCRFFLSASSFFLEMIVKISANRHEK